MATKLGLEAQGVNLKLTAGTGGAVDALAAPFYQLQIALAKNSPSDFTAPLFEHAYVATTDGTATVAWQKALAAGDSYCVAVFAQGKKQGAADCLTAFHYNTISNASGTVAAAGTTGGSDVESSAGSPVVTIVADNSGKTAQIKVTGIAAENWEWSLLIVSFGGNVA